MQFRLSPAARSEGHRLHSHDTLGSTNSEALDLARGGETGPLWITTRRQVAGRGRRGNAWSSPEGNLAASLLVSVSGVAPELIATIGFVAGVALVEALRDAAGTGLSPGVRGMSRGEAGTGTGGSGPAPSPQAIAGSPPAIHLKWPNDVLADGRKLAGILLEAETLPGGRRSVVIGFGVNVASAPDGLPYPTAALSAFSAADAPMLFEFLSERFVEAARIWNKGRGFAEIRRLWLERAAGVGAPVSVRTAGATLSGTFETIDEGGRLVILAPDGTRRTVTAGEVHFGSAATAA
ncbi:biotin--[acetyl-CoA-carboxylase] ligase [Methylobacterium sp. Leaf118]|uniref:biotin--[acetyl-CoA-carboxylase] ligase n=1 Tax=Methylobacterium sp. Leaf118 TaxID=2876562 RepID=UPI001E2B54C4|nr:biotin--[acetyl-CoA-carboxylase] ligase [Methylobacterium sp. Leaf118]